MSKNLTAILIILVLALLVGASYLILQNQQLIGQLTKQTSPTSSTNPEFQTSTQASLTPTPSPILTLTLTQNAIKTNINAKNYQGLIPYMAGPKINLSLMSSECCEPMTPNEAAKQLSYIDEGLPFDFNQESEVVKNLKSKNSQLVDTYIGVSKTQEQMIAFTIDNQNLISSIQLAISYKLYSF